jgi:F-type H+-transporting ATPase subunit b
MGVHLLPRRIMLQRIAIALFFLLALICPLRAAEPNAETPRSAAPAAAHAPQDTAPTAQKEKEEEKPELIKFDVESGIWTLIIFFILLAILYKGAWKNVIASLKGREERIRNDLAQAESARQKAEEALKDYNAKLADAEARGREILAKANSDALALAERIKAAADKAAQERADRAAREIEEARDQALRQIYEQAAELSTNIAEKILRRSLNANDQRDLVAQSLEQMQNVNRG